MNLPIKLPSEKQKEIEIVEEGFLDCVAGGNFIDQNYTRMKGIKMEALKELQLASADLKCQVLPSDEHKTQMCQVDYARGLLYWVCRSLSIIYIYINTTN